MSTPCMKCGEPSEHAVKFSGLLGETFLCLPCLSPAIAEFERLKSQESDLIAAGVSETLARSTVADRIDGQAPS